MKRLPLAVLAATVAGALLLSACSSESSTESASSATTTTAAASSAGASSSAPASSAPGSDAVSAEAPAFAGCGDASGSVSWYTSQDVDSTTAMAKDFESRCPNVKVDIQQSPALPLFSRFQQEQAAGVDTADVLSVAGYGLYDQARQGELIVPMDKSILTGYPAEFADPDGYMFSNRIVTMMIVVNTNVIKAGDEPKTWKDLLDPKYTGQIALTDPVQNGTGYILLWQLQATPGLGQDYLDALAKQHPVMLPTTGQTTQALVSGEYGIGMIPDDAAWLQVMQGAPLKVIAPTEGVGVNPNYNMLVKTAPNPKAANAFLLYLASQEGGQASADAIKDYVAWPNILPPPPGRLPLADLTLLTNDGAKQAEEQATKSQEFFALFSGS